MFHEFIHENFVGLLLGGHLLSSVSEYAVLRSPGIGVRESGEIGLDHRFNDAWAVGIGAMQKGMSRALLYGRQVSPSVGRVPDYPGIFLSRRCDLCELTRVYGRLYKSLCLPAACESPR
jgi:hypothetical protein